VLISPIGKRVTVPITNTEAQHDHGVFPRSKPGKRALKLFTK
jgi:hypothetical protein